MTDQNKPFRLVRPRLWTALGTIAAASLAAGTPVMAGAASGSANTGYVVAQSGSSSAGEKSHQGGEGGHNESAHKKASGSGGEGGESGMNHDGDEVEFLAAIGFMEGHLRAGLKLYETADLTAAKTHMGHPIKEKYEAVEETLEDRGFGDLESKIVALAEAAEHEKPFAEIQSLFAAVEKRIDDVQAASPGGAAAGLMALSKLTRIAAEEYSEGVEDGKVSNLHEYQDSWGFQRTVESEATKYSASSKPDVAAAGQKILDQVMGLTKAYGDIQGQGEMTMDPALLYGAAARMEIAALAVK